MTAEQIHETGSIAYRGPVAGVHVHAHMEFGPYALVVPLDTKVAIQLMFMLGEQSRQGPDAGPLRVTPQTVLERLRELGVVSGNGSRLVGRDAVYESFARLRAKGYIRRITERDDRGRPTGTAYEFYDWPSWNPDAPKPSETTDSPTFPQVKSTSGIAGSGIAGSDNAQMGSNQRSTQVKSTSGNAGSGNAGSGNAGSPFPQVKSTSGNAGSPPHPPEEEELLLPPTPHASNGSLPSQREEAAEFSSEEVAAAAAFLQEMQQWQAGAATARKCAPKLLRTMRTQGWPPLAGMDEVHRQALEADILKNTAGAKAWTRCLPGWVEDLRRYRRPAPAAAPAEAGQQDSASAAALRDCPACDEYGWVLDDDDDAPSRRCTHPAATVQPREEQPR
ncbi:pentapeptide repeat-containing protein [Streptomyces sp. NPDC047999]|uniref:pentapeptide repeat-containing protein n=1 Tax=Streptomyces sp. NPDC047999 TaxID=3365497 RepID=UPI00371E4B71